MVEKKFRKDAKRLKKKIKPFLVKWFGEKCDDYNSDCVNCKRWEAFSNLIGNPFKD